MPLETTPPLVTDLDGTLIKTDLLCETANRCLARRPVHALRSLRWLVAGRSVLKARLAEASGLDPALLPYNEPVVAWLRQRKAEGRHLILATASHRSLAQPVAHHLGIFDEVLATEGETNLKGERKRELLVSRYGERGFDYLGDDAADLPVWRSADRAYVVTSSPTLVAKVRSLGNLAGVFEDGRPPVLITLVRALRPHQWLKNLLVPIPLFASHRYGDTTLLLQALLAFVVFSLASSGLYIFNDLVDVTDDRRHVNKRSRPFAAGDLSLVLGWLVWPALLAVAFVASALLLPAAFVWWTAAYVILTLAYSLGLKQLVVIDVMVLASLYALRIVAGAAAVNVPLSFWLLAFSMFFFLSLALIKRFSELKAARDGGRKGRISGRGYKHEDLELVSSLGIASGYLSVLVLAFYIRDAHAAQLYATPEFIWPACPLLLFWLSRAWLLAHRGRMHEDPVLFAARDLVSWAVVACFVAVFVLASVVG
jgi:4-hydroxybenzoate polyprenyltransferase/phosphoserine phosphatase